MRSKRFLKLAASVGLLAILAACAPVYETTPTTPETIEIGVITALSGEASVYGIAQQWIYNTAADEINAAGGINGKKIHLNFEDSACDATMSNKAASNLISVKKVQIILGGMCSGDTLASAPLAEQNKVVMLSSMSSSAQVSQAGDYIFRNYPSDNAQGEALANYATSAGFKTVGLMVEEQPFSEGIADTFKTTFEKNGGTALVEKFSKDASDFRTQITKLQSQKADIYFIDTQAPAKADLMIKQLKEAGIKGPFIMNDSSFGDRDMLARYKEYLDGSVSAEVPYDHDSPKLIELQTKYKAATTKELPVPTYMAPSYDAVYIIKEAIEKVGYDGTKIKDYLYTVKGRKGLAGTLSFDVNGDPDSTIYKHSLKVFTKGTVEDYTAPAKQ